MNISTYFELATRAKIRFEHRGTITTEDLWDLSLNDLDKIFRALNKQVKTAQEESLLNTRSREDEILAIKIEIVKYIFETKQAEAALARGEAERKAQKQKLAAILAEKQEISLRNLTEEELQAMISQL